MIQISKRTPNTYMQWSKTCNSRVVLKKNQKHRAQYRTLTSPHHLSFSTCLITQFQNISGHPKFDFCIYFFFNLLVKIIYLFLFLINWRLMVHWSSDWFQCLDEKQEKIDQFHKMQPKCEAKTSMDLLLTFKHSGMFSFTIPCKLKLQLIMQESPLRSKSISILTEFAVLDPSA